MGGPRIRQAPFFQVRNTAISLEALVETFFVFVRGYLVIIQQPPFPNVLLLFLSTGTASSCLFVKRGFVYK